MKITKYSPTAVNRCAIPILTILSTTLPLAEAREIGARAYRFVWPSQPNTGDYITASGGTVTDPSSEESFNSYAAASFHTLAVSCSATGLNNDQQSRPGVGGEAYWFDQITISSPTVPEGTVGTVDFTLFFEGSMDTAEAPVGPGSAEYFATLGYRVAGIADGSDGRPDLGVGDRYERNIFVRGDIQIEGLPEFYLNQPQHHQIVFRYGVPFDFTISISAMGAVWNHFSSSMSASLRLKGWNGFQNIRVRDDAAVTDAVTDAGFVSPSGFNYGNAGTTSFVQWASLFNVSPTSPGEDSNNNGVSNLREYALGRHPLEPDRGSPFTPGRMTLGGNEYACFSFTRPALGARAAGINYLPQCSNDLGGGWSSTGVETTVTPSATSQTETVTVRSIQPMATQTREFLRLEVAPTP